MRVSSTIPLSRMTRVMPTLKRSARKTARWIATMPAAIAVTSATPSDCWTNTMVATIAPGPASRGVPSGTSATLTSRTSLGSSARSVSSSSATMSSSSPPAPCSAGMPMPRKVRICCPTTANSEMTTSETSTAWPASRARTLLVRPGVSPRNSGMLPSGSMITNSVTKTAPNSVRSKNSLIGAAPGSRPTPPREAPRTPPPTSSARRAGQPCWRRGSRCCRCAAGPAHRPGR